MVNREYISVLFEEKDHAKQLGARWDAEVKKWYIPDNVKKINKLTLREKYKINNEPILELIGEDRSFGGNESSLRVFFLIFVLTPYELIDDSYSKERLF